MKQIKDEILNGGFVMSITILIEELMELCEKAMKNGGPMEELSSENLISFQTIIEKGVNGVFKFTSSQEIDEFVDILKKLRD